VEQKIEGKAFESIPSAYRYLENHFFRLRKLFPVSIHHDRVKLIRKGEAIARLSNRMGHALLLTNQKEWTKSDILSLYRSQDLLEKLFDVLKNEINGKRLRVSSRAGAEGRIFLSFSIRHFRMP